MSTLWMAVAVICITILLFGIFLRMILIAMIVAAVIAVGGLTLHYSSGDSVDSPSPDRTI